MINFQYIRVATPKAAVDAIVKDNTAQWIAGGTNLVDLMKKGAGTQCLRKKWLLFPHQVIVCHFAVQSKRTNT